MNKNNYRKWAYFLVFTLVLGLSGVAHGATENNRYLVKSNSGFWKKSFGVRHEFKDGFTTDMSEWQLRVAKMFGIEVVPVIKVFILTEGEASAVTPEIEDISAPKGKPSPSPVPPERIIPTAQLPWGVKAIYNDLLIEKTAGGADATVAVLDTGVLRTHPDLQNRITQCKDFSAAKQPIIDDKCDDKNGHGTHVTGIIAADGGTDGLGIYGVAPETNIFAYKVCGTNGSCWADDIARAIDTASVEGANIINMSLGSDTESSLIRDAIERAVANNVLVVAAAGNDGPDIGSIDYPAANPDVVGVGAFDVDFAIAEWSSRGVNSLTELGSASLDVGDIDFAAPGVNVESTSKDGGYIRLSGTSMATPHIVGLAAKLWNKDDPTAIRGILINFTDDLAPPIGEDDSSGFGFPHL